MHSIYCHYQNHENTKEKKISVIFAFEYICEYNVDGWHYNKLFYYYFYYYCYSPILFFHLWKADQPLNLHNGKVSFTIHCMHIIVRVLATNPAIRNKNGLHCYCISTMIITPGNVVRGNPKLCKWNPYGSSRPWFTDLQTVNKQVNAPWILHLVNFHMLIFLNRAMWFPIVFISTPDEMNMGVENQAVWGVVLYFCFDRGWQMFSWHRR